MQQKQKHQILQKPEAVIIHNATRPLTVQSEIWMRLLAAANAALSRWPAAAERGSRRQRSHKLISVQLSKSLLIFKLRVISYNQR